MTMFSRVAAMLARNAKLAGGISIEYRRGADRLTLTAIKGRSEHEKVDRQGFTFEIQSDDFIVSATELRIGGVAIEPKPGDEIRETVGSETWVYELLPIAGEICWRWSDQTRTLIRIHTKRIRVE